MENYRPASLLLICIRIFKCLIYNSLFEFFIANELIYSNQSCFKPGDSCIKQLFSITHEIYKSFDDGYEVRGVFLDISKTLDKVWHSGLIYKLKQNGISGDLLNLITDFFNAKKLNDDLKKIKKWAFQWKLSFGSDPNKEGQEFIFSRWLNKPNHPSLNFMVVIQSTTYKDTKLDFQENLKTKLNKISKATGLLRKLQKILTPLLTLELHYLQ